MVKVRTAGANVGRTVTVALVADEDGQIDGDLYVVDGAEERLRRTAMIRVADACSVVQLLVIEATPPFLAFLRG
jgi:hypothetical protein